MSTAEFRQGTHGTASGSSMALSFTIPVGVMNLLLVGLSWTDTSKSVTSVVDTTNGWTFTPVSAKITNTGVAMQLWYISASEAGDVEVTATLDGNTGISMFILEYNGIAIEAPIIDEEAHATGAGTPADSGATAMTSSGDLLVFGILGLAGGATEHQPGEGFTQREQMARLMGLEKIVAVDGAYNATASWTEGVDVDVAWCCQVVAFAAFDAPGPETLDWPDIPLPFSIGLGLTNVYLPVLRAHGEIGFTYSASVGLPLTYYGGWGSKLRALVATGIDALTTLAAAADTAGVEYDVLCYNLEARGGVIPEPVSQTTAAAAIAATYSKPLMMALGGKLFDLYVADVPTCAAMCDYWLIQCQRQQIYPAGAYYKSEVLSRINTVLSGHADIGLLIQMSDWRGHYGGLQTPAQMLEYMKCLAQLVSEEGVTILHVNLFDNKDPAPPAVLHGLIDLVAPPRWDHTAVAGYFWQPSAYVLTEASPGKILEMADGSVRRHWAGNGLLKLDVQWKGISAAEVTALETLYRAGLAGSLLWEDIEGGNYWVRSVPRTWRWASVTVEGGYAYNVQLSLRGTEVM